MQLLVAVKHCKFLILLTAECSLSCVVGVEVVDQKKIICSTSLFSCAS
jgi:hypothetical protein